MNVDAYLKKASIYEAHSNTIVSFYVLKEGYNITGDRKIARKLAELLTKWGNEQKSIGNYDTAIDYYRALDYRSTYLPASDALRAAYLEEEQSYDSVEVYDGQCGSTEIENTSIDNMEFTYKTYKNDRYGFSIDYPSIFEAVEAPDNNDGKEFTSSDGVKLIVYGSNNSTEDTAKSVYNTLVTAHPNISYKKQKGNWYVISYIDNNEVVYEKGVIGTGSSNIFNFRYPVSKKEVYDPVVNQLVSSFKTPNIDEVH